MALKKKKKRQSFIEEYNKSRATVIYATENEKKALTRGFNNIPQRGNARSKTSHYDKYQYKLESGNIEKFNSRDILYFFKDLANDNGNKYMIPSFQVEMAKIRNIMNKGYSPTDMVAMIEFLFTSGQTYLETKTLAPGILATGWCNKIYQDTQDWLNDEFDPNPTKKVNKKSKDNLVRREWNDDEGDEW